MVDRLILSRAAIAVGAASFLFGCGGSSEESGGPGGGGGAAPAVQVVAIEASRQPIIQELALVGSVAANEMVEIKSEVDGAISAIHFNEGQRVEGGDLLVELDPSKLQASLEEARASFELSKANYERGKQLRNDNLISQQEFDQAASAFALNQASIELKERHLKDTKIFAPFSGVMGARNISPGQVISKNISLCWVVDLDPVKIEFNVPERFLGDVEDGQEVNITVAAYRGDVFTGKVFFVSPYINPETRTALVKAEVANPDHRLKPGMFANVDLTIQVRDDALMIPEAAVHQLLAEDRASIFIVTNATAQPRTIRIGLRLPGRVEVVEGLAEGEIVVVEGTQKVAPGISVRLAPAESAAPYLNQEQ